MIGHHQVEQISFDFDEVHEFSFADYLELLELPVDDVGVLPYIRNKFLHQDFPELSADVGSLDWLEPTWLEREPLASLLRAMRPNWFNWSELFVCQPSVRYPMLHVDHCMFHSWSAQIYGVKRYWVWPTMRDFVDVHCLGKELDTLLGVEPISIDVGPGDVVVIPSGLPHVAESLTTSITIAASFVDETNDTEFAREFFATDLLRALR